MMEGKCLPSLFMQWLVVAYQYWHDRCRAALLGVHVCWPLFCCEFDWERDVVLYFPILLLVSFLDLWEDCGSKRPGRRHSIGSSWLCIHIWWFILSCHLTGDSRIFDSQLSRHICIHWVSYLVFLLDLKTLVVERRLFHTASLFHFTPIGCELDLQ